MGQPPRPQGMVLYYYGAILGHANWWYYLYVLTYIYCRETPASLLWNRIIGYEYYYYWYERIL